MILQPKGILDHMVITVPGSVQLLSKMHLKHQENFKGCYFYHRFKQQYICLLDHMESQLIYKVACRILCGMNSQERAQNFESQDPVSRNIYQRSKQISLMALMLLLGFPKILLVALLCSRLEKLISKFNE